MASREAGGFALHKASMASVDLWARSSVKPTPSVNPAGPRPGGAGWLPHARLRSVPAAPSSFNRGDKR